MLDTTTFPSLTRVNDISDLDRDSFSTTSKIYENSKFSLFKYFFLTGVL